MFFDPFSEMEPPGLIAIIIALILIDILLLKLTLIITNAQEKRKMKWVAGSFGIQFGIIFFIASPVILYGMIGKIEGEVIVIVIVLSIFSIFIDLNVINVIHKIGLKKSFVVVIFVAGPIIFAMYLIGQSLGGTIL
ncbi:MAG: hypothetical protein ACFFCE_07380 [Promethearchaeota archaeon]